MLIFLFCHITTLNLWRRT